MAAAIVRYLTVVTCWEGMLQDFLATGDTLSLFEALRFLTGAAIQ